ncbi:curlin repeat-containing protein [Fodinibius sp. AD559]|uniref:curlin repeat-containing protein n=1 Tax=Fodinibius sp. AD559 TaxID=3424179 RepID=UPI004046BAC5
MENSRQKYWFYRIVSVAVLVALAFLLKHDLQRFINPAPPASPESQQVVPPDIYFLSLDSTLLGDGTLSDLDSSVKPKVPLYRPPKIIKPNIQKNLNTSGIKVEKIKLKKPEKSVKESELVQQEQSDRNLLFDLPEFANNIGFSWIVNNQGGAIDFNLKRQSNRQSSPRIAQVNNNLSYYELGQNNELDDEIVGSFGNRRMITQIGIGNYLSQTLYNTYYSDFIVTSIGNYNTTIQNVFNAYNARLSVTQNGSYNRVRQDIYSEDVFGTFNRTENEVRQIGSYNLFRSQQIGVSNTIRTVQQGSLNNVDISQQGSNNSAQVRQSGQGNTVSIEQN